MPSSILHQDGRPVSNQTCTETIAVHLEIQKILSSGDKHET